MSTDNIAKFRELLASDPALRERARVIEAEVLQQTAHQLAALAHEVGVPVDAAAFLATPLPPSSLELSEETLDSVAGGFSREQWEQGRRLQDEDERANPSLVMFGECRRS